MNQKLIGAAAVLLAILPGLVRGEGAPSGKPAAPAATRPTATAPPKPPEVLKDAIDPFDATKERARFFTALPPGDLLEARGRVDPENRHQIGPRELDETDVIFEEQFLA